MSQFASDQLNKTKNWPIVDHLRLKGWPLQSDPDGPGYVPTSIQQQNQNIHFCPS